MLIFHDLPLIPMVLTNMYLQTILVLILFATKLAVHSLSGYMLANDVSNQITPLCGSLSTTKAYILFFILIR